MTLSTLAVSEVPTSHCYRRIMQPVRVPAMGHLSMVEIQSELRCAWARTLRDISPICELDLEIGTILLPHESAINGPEYERRIRPLVKRLPGVQHALYVYKHPREFSELALLPPGACIDFLGTRLTHGGQFPSHSCLIRQGDWLVLEWHAQVGGTFKDFRIAIASEVPAC